MMRTTVFLAGLAMAGMAIGCSAGSGGDLSGAGAGGGGASGAGGGGGGGSSGQGGTLNLDSGTGGGGGLDPDSACLTESYGAQARPASLLFQLDTTRSMNCPLAQPGCLGADPGSANSRWNVFRDKLKVAISQLPQENSAGLMHYPTNICGAYGQPACSSIDQCVAENSPDVQLAPLSTNLAEMQAKIDAIVPNGVTPTRVAFDFAANYLENKTASGDKYVVLATDGQLTMCVGCTQDSSCGLDAETAALAVDVKTYANKGIKTFVIGVPGSAGYASSLSQLAQNGGTARPNCTGAAGNYCHFDLSDSANNFGDLLSQALAAIAGEALSCVYDIPSTDAGTFDKNKVNVQLTSGGTTDGIPRDSTRQDGWDYSDDGTQIVLYGPACEEAKASAGGKIDILYGCPTIVK